MLIIKTNCRRCGLTYEYSPIKQSRIRERQVSNEELNSILRNECAICVLTDLVHFREEVKTL